MILHRFPHQPFSGDLRLYGHAGPRVLVFPTSMGWSQEWEDRGMIAELAEPIAAGRVQVLAVPSVDGESWYADAKHPRERAAVHARYDAWLRDEVLPWWEATQPHPTLITAGASFGGYHALCFAGRYPHLVSRALVMSGLVDITRLTNGYTDDLVHAYNPAAFLRMEHDPARIAALQRVQFILAVGRDDTLRAQNEALAGDLWQRGIGNALRLWDGWAHDWPWWRRMIRLYLDGPD
ncbi:MAG TPA: alpha/beta hydrolase-fold protein [Gemmatimonadales bacterium]|nr:alpha/beta hydrolase-fold protein [Gemmatimonadales bacterium]